MNDNGAALFSFIWSVWAAPSLLRSPLQASFAHSFCFAGYWLWAGGQPAPKQTLHLPFLFIYIYSFFFLLINYLTFFNQLFIFSISFTLLCSSICFHFNLFSFSLMDQFISFVFFSSFLQFIDLWKIIDLFND